MCENNRYLIASRERYTFTNDQQIFDEIKKVTNKTVKPGYD